MTESNNDEMPTKPPLFALDRSTLVPIGLLISVVVSAVAGTAWIQRTLLELDYKISDLSSKVGYLTEAVNDRWTYSMQSAWTDLLQAKNPNLTIPAPGKIR